MKRIKPCDTCQRRRRKCQATNNTCCTRCARLGVPCSFVTGKNGSFPTTADVEDLAEIDGRDELLQLYNSVYALSNDLHKMHQQQYQLREKTSANPLKAQKEWQLSIINGHLRLETGIVSIKDLLQFAHPSPIRSLSAFDTTCVPFQIGNQLSFIALTTKQLVKRGLYDSSSKTFSNAKNTYFTSSLSLEFPNTQLTSTLDPFGSMLSRNLRQIECVPLALTLDDPENVIVKFIEQFLKCYQTSLPLLHEPTYMQYFKKCHDNVVRDNMDPALAHGPVTLAICTFMSISCCHHLQLNLLQRRRLAEHFYEKCYTQLCDILDDSRPCKQLEALMTINFLQKFFFMTLRLQNMHRMGSIAILLVGELGKVTKELSQVERAILQRHATYASIFFACVEYISCKRMDDIHMTEVPLDILPDESEESKNCLCVYVHSLRLVLNPTFKQMVKHVRRIIIDEEIVSIDLEIIVGFEAHCRSWWGKLPSGLKYCEDPFSISSKAAVLKAKCPYALLAHATVLSVCCGVFTILTFPRNTESDTSAHIQWRSREMALKCCDILLSIDTQMRKISPYCGFTSEYLIRVYDSLCTLLGTSVKGDTDNKRASIRKFVQECFGRITPPAAVELLTGPSGNENTKYQRSPLPGYVFIWDLVTSAAKNVGIKI